MSTVLCLFLLCALGVSCALGARAPSHAARIAALALVALFTGCSVSTSQEPQRCYLGFDRNEYPGDQAMKLLRRDFAFTGYWLGNPPGETTNSRSEERRVGKEWRSRWAA